MDVLKNKRPDFKKIQEALVLAAIAGLTISYFGGYYLIITTIGHHSRLLRQLAVILLFFKVATTRYTRREFACVSVLLSLAFVNYKATGNTAALYNFLTLCALKDVGIKKVLRVSCISLTLIVLLMGILALKGVTGTVSITDYFGRNDPETGYGKLETRYCMGYIHPNQWSLAVFMILALAVLGFYDRMNWKDAVIWAFINYEVYRLSVSRTAFLCGMILLILFLIAKYAGKLLELLIVRIGIVMGVSLLWSSPLLLDTKTIGEKLLAIDYRAFTGRLGMAKIYFEKFGLSAFGQKIPDELEGGIVLDMGYMRMLLENGVIIYGTLFACVIALLLYAFHKKRKDAVIFVICISLYGVYENSAIAQVPAGLFIYYLAELLYSGENLKRLPEEENHVKIK